MANAVNVGEKHRQRNQADANMRSYLNSRALLLVAFVGSISAVGALLLTGPGPQTAQSDAARPFKEVNVGQITATPAPRTDTSFVIRRILPISGPIKYGEWHWDEAGVPDGPLVMTVDLDARVISVFRGGYEIGAAAVLLGTDEKPTPLGVFPIMQKKRHHVSSIYDAPMPYMQRLTNDGISLHETKVEKGYASHGCIGLPTGFAEKVFAATRIGDPVIITRGKRIGMGESLTG